jgi:hypothetical protein
VATGTAGRSRRRRTARRDRPLLNTNFTVVIEAPDAASRDLGCCEVILPELPVRRPAKAAETVSGETAPRLVLKRGFDGSPDLRDWWKDTRRRKSPRPRTVTVSLLAEDCRTVVATWVFAGARPISLAYSPLQASAPAVIIEGIELEFDDVELW